MSKKSLTSGLAAAALVVSLGYAYAQTSSESPSAPPSGPDRAQMDQATPPNATSPSTTPSTTTTPAPTYSAPSTVPAEQPVTNSTNPASPHANLPTDSSTSTMPSSSNTTMDEPAPRADRN